MSKFIKTLSGIPKLISKLKFYWTAGRRMDKLWTTGNYEELISQCNVMISKDPTYYMGFYYRGLANEMLSFFDEAIEDLKNSDKALNASKRKNLAKWYLIGIPIQLSRVYRKQQNNEMSMEYANNAVDKDSKGVRGLKYRATLKEDSGDYIGASEDLNEAIRRRPNDKSLLKLRDRLTYIIIERRGSQPRVM